MGAGATENCPVLCYSCPPGPNTTTTTSSVTTVTNTSNRTEGLYSPGWCRGVYEPDSCGAELIPADCDERSQLGSVARDLCPKMCGQDCTVVEGVEFARANTQGSAGGGGGGSDSGELDAKWIILTMLAVVVVLLVAVVALVRWRSHASKAHLFDGPRHADLSHHLEWQNMLPYNDLMTGSPARIERFNPVAGMHANEVSGGPSDTRAHFMSPLTGTNISPIRAPEQSSDQAATPIVHEPYLSPGPAGFQFRKIPASLKAHMESGANGDVGADEGEIKPGGARSGNARASTFNHAHFDVSLGASVEPIDFAAGANRSTSRLGTHVSDI